MIMPTSGVMIPSLNALTIAANAAPMTTATARSTTLPRMRNALNSLSMASLPFGSRPRWVGRVLARRERECFGQRRDEDARLLHEGFEPVGAVGAGHDDRGVDHRALDGEASEGRRVVRGADVARQLG